MWDIIAMCIGLGELIMFAFVIIALQMSKKQYPVTFICLEERQGAMKVKTRKGFPIKDTKIGLKNYGLKKTVFEGGIQALFDRAYTMTQVPEKLFCMVKEGGGDMILTFSPAENVYLPIRLIRNDELVNMIIQDTEWRNWDKQTIEKYMMAKVLNPEKEGFWNKNPGAVIIGAGMICVILLIVSVGFVLPFLTSQNSAIASQVSSIWQQLDMVGASVGSAVSGVNVIPPAP